MKRKRNPERRVGMFQSPEWRRSLMHVGMWNQGGGEGTGEDGADGNQTLASLIHNVASILGNCEGFNQQRALRREGHDWV